MIKKILIGLVSIIILAFGVIYFLAKPTLEEDGSYSPSSLALKLGTVSVSDYEEVTYTKYQGDKSKILIIFTEYKNLEMKNGKLFSTGNHPIEALVPMLHLKNAGFDFHIVTPNGNPVVFEMWAFPNEDENVKAIYQEYKSKIHFSDRACILKSIYNKNLVLSKNWKNNILVKQRKCPDESLYEDLVENIRVQSEIIVDNSNEERRCDYNSEDRNESKPFRRLESCLFSCFTSCAPWFLMRRIYWNNK